MTNDGAERLIDRACRAFIARFDSAPKFGAIAPGRVNLIGEHTDYNDGFVMPLAIDRYTVAVAAPTTQPFSTLRAADLDQTHCVDLAKPLQPIGGHFADYVLAVIDQFKKRGVAVPNVDLLVTGNIPRGAGLSSSASLEVAIALLMEQFTDTAMTPNERATLCHRAEHEFVGVPCGIMDMLSVANATKDSAMLLDCRSMQYESVPLALGVDAALLVVNTGVARSLRSSEYAARRQTCAAAARKLAVRSLRDATMPELYAATSFTVDERNKAQHVLEENDRVVQAADALRRRDFATIGELMFASHASLRDLYQVSCAELDAVVACARSLQQKGQGAFGARMTGAGFGGCAIILCQANVAGEIADEIAGHFVKRFGYIPAVFAAQPVNGAMTFDVKQWPSS